MRGLGIISADIHMFNFFAALIAKAVITVFALLHTLISFCMAFARLTYRESMRNFECCLGAMWGKHYHIQGLGVKSLEVHYPMPMKNRDWRIYCDFAQILIHQARQLYSNDDFALQLQETDEIRLKSLHSFTDFAPYSF